MSDKINSIYDYWFEGVSTTSIPKKTAKRWFAGGKETDEEIRSRFGAWLEPAAAGHFDDWQQSSRGTLALLILLDQFPLNIFRGAAEAYAYEEQALTFCRNGLARGQDAELDYAERIFFYMPLEHSESLADQTRSVELFHTLAKTAPIELREHATGTLDYAIKHREIIDRFGRFPHRNRVLGRDQTEEESAFLQDTQNRFGQ